MHAIRKLVPAAIFPTLLACSQPQPQPQSIAVNIALPPVSDFNVDVDKHPVESLIEVPGQKNETWAVKPAAAPVYPPILLFMRREGRGVVDCVVGPDGFISECKIVAWRNSQLFAQSVLDWAKTPGARFNPAIVHWEPTSIPHRFDVKFQLNATSGQSLAGGHARGSL